jgi:large subunit ribosomal protein L10
VVLTEYKGITVQQLTAFRDELRKLGVEYKVVKNTLARIASSETPAAVAKEHFTGPIGVAITYGDPAAAIKSVLEYSKKNEKLKVNVGVMDGTLYGLDDLKKIADLPPREVLLAQMAGTFKAPTSKLARLLQATVVRFAYAMNALKDKRAA